MKSNRFIQVFILLLFVVYFSQGVLYTQSSILSQGAFVFFILISIFYMVKTGVFNIPKNAFFKAWTLLLTLNIFGFIFTGSVSNPMHYGMIKGILLCALPFFPFYYFARKGVLEIKYLSVFLMIMLPVYILQYYFRETQILSEKISGSEDVVNNAAYTFVALIPYVFLLKNNKNFANILMIVSMFFIMQSAKRGALITGVLGLSIFLYYQIKTINKKQKLRGLLLISIGIVIMFYFLKQFYESNEYLIARLQSLEEGDSSGRDIIYRKIWRGWMDGNSLQLLFGFGFASSIQFAGNYAHNDWLELLSNFGLTGITLYLLLFYYGFKTVFTRKTSPAKKLLLLCVMIQWLFITLVSMGYTSNSDGYLRAILLGYLMGSESKELE